VWCRENDRWILIGAQGYCDHEWYLQVFMQTVRIRAGDGMVPGQPGPNDWE